VGDGASQTEFTLSRPRPIFHWSKLGLRVGVAGILSLRGVLAKFLDESRDVFLPRLGMVFTPPGRPCVDALRTTRLLPRVFPCSAQFAPFGGGATAELSPGTVFNVPASRTGPAGPIGTQQFPRPWPFGLRKGKVPYPPAFVSHPVLRGLAGAHFMMVACVPAPSVAT
jgi:hypothetical protein